MLEEPLFFYFLFFIFYCLLIFLIILMRHPRTKPRLALTDA